MNPKFKELADEAKMSTYLLAYGLEFNISIEKFAELIVRECAEQSMSIGRYNTSSNITPDLAIAIAVGLKKHFGVD
jgi:hypothetical protein